MIDISEMNYCLDRYLDRGFDYLKTRISPIEEKTHKFISHFYEFMRKYYVYGAGTKLK